MKYEVSTHNSCDSQWYEITEHIKCGVYTTGKWVETIWENAEKLVKLPGYGECMHETVIYSAAVRLPWIDDVYDTRQDEVFDYTEGLSTAFMTDRYCDLNPKEAGVINFATSENRSIWNLILELASRYKIDGNYPTPFEVKTINEWAETDEYWLYKTINTFKTNNFTFFESEGDPLGELAWGQEWDLRLIAIEEARLAAEEAAAEEAAAEEAARKIQEAIDALKDQQTVSTVIALMYM